MNADQARKILETADYQPWRAVARAENVLGVKKPTVSEMWAEALAAAKARANTNAPTPGEK